MKEKPTFVSPLFRTFLSWPHPKDGEECQCTFLYSQFYFQLWSQIWQYLGGQEVLYLIPQNSGDLLKLIHIWTHTLTYMYMQTHTRTNTNTHVCMRTLWSTAEISASYKISPVCLPILKQMLTPDIFSIWIKQQFLTSSFSLFSSFNILQAFRLI
jgi:hypothetical protein